MTAIGEDDVISFAEVNFGVSAGRIDQVVAVAAIDGIVTEMQEHIVTETGAMDNRSGMGIGQVSAAGYSSHISLSFRVSSTCSQGKQAQVRLY